MKVKLYKVKSQNFLVCGPLSNKFSGRQSYANHLMFSYIILNKKHCTVSVPQKMPSNKYFHSFMVNFYLDTQSVDMLMQCVPSSCALYTNFSKVKHLNIRYIDNTSPFRIIDNMETTFRKMLR